MRNRILKNAGGIWTEPPLSRLLPICKSIRAHVAMASFIQNMLWNSVEGFVEAGKRTAGGYAGDALIKAGDLVENSGRSVGNGKLWICAKRDGTAEQWQASNAKRRATAPPSRANDTSPPPKRSPRQHASLPSNAPTPLRPPRASSAWDRRAKPRSVPTNSPAGSSLLRECPVRRASPATQWAGQRAPRLPSLSPSRIRTMSRPAPRPSPTPSQNPMGTAAARRRQQSGQASRSRSSRKRRRKSHHTPVPVARRQYARRHTSP
ncbi:hypothetical protein CC80DRAFT_275501 [Byssothecium circinans]|uniref:Uncharacterized protein n=1 Tax=Byssothecium circinans TaxID=147558 RepID=A0A6A5TAU5_9PLEO|nr:hypothetical protein CC80DRAFT_275501 [Byssothecium circinans]